MCTNTHTHTHTHTHTLPLVVGKTLRSDCSYGNQLMTSFNLQKVPSIHNTLHSPMLSWPAVFITEVGFILATIVRCHSFVSNQGCTIFWQYSQWQQVCGVAGLKLSQFLFQSWLVRMRHSWQKASTVNTPEHKWCLQANSYLCLCITTMSFSVSLCGS